MKTYKIDVKKEAAKKLFPSLEKEKIYKINDNLIVDKNGKFLESQDIDDKALKNIIDFILTNKDKPKSFWVFNRKKFPNTDIPLYSCIKGNVVSYDEKATIAKKFWEDNNSGKFTHEELIQRNPCYGDYGVLITYNLVKIIVELDDKDCLILE